MKKSNFVVDVMTEDEIGNEYSFTIDFKSRDWKTARKEIGIVIGRAIPVNHEITKMAYGKKNKFWYLKNGKRWYYKATRWIYLVES